ncbi:hypothetical protein [Pseudomonas sp. B1(2018)]|uniref:hypothetical protein n=1 Tax=Pseudomonas sp. B1(2018) TaxID=2233856 RepID=UPI0010582C38|nr:hypothetical protein [Pseudomonas sp. B1(2018)]
MLCLQQHKLVKAHAIPEAFFRELRVDGEKPLLVSSEPGFFPKHAPIGVYDDTILCNVCEKNFDGIDNYGIDALLSKFHKYFQPLERNGETLGFESSQVDKNRLLQFLVAVLWRASVSSHPFYSKVNLGPHESLARAALNTNTTALSPVFDAVLSRWRDEGEHIPTTAMLDPRREKWFGVNAYRLYFGETVAYIKVDKQPFTPQLKAISLRTAPPIFVVNRVLSESKDFHMIKRTVQRSQANKLKYRNARLSDK